MANNVIKRIWNQNKLVNIEALNGMAFQAEDGGHTFEISGVDGDGNAVALSGTVAGVFRRPDNADIALTGTASGGVVSVTLSDACYAVTGKFGLTIFVTADGKKTAVYAAIGTVAGTTGGAVAGDTPQDVVDLINSIEAAIAEIPASYTDIMAAIAPTYSSSAVYAYGSYAWYDGVLYRCTFPIVSGETFTSGHWATVPISGGVSELRRDVDFQYRKLDVSWNDNGYISNSDGTVITYSNWKYTDYIDVSDSPHAYIIVDRVSQQNDDRSYNAAYDKDKNYLGQIVVPSGGGATALPPDTAFVRLSCRNATACSVSILLWGDQSLKKPIKWYSVSNKVYLASDKLEMEYAKYMIHAPSSDYVVSWTQYDHTGTTLQNGDWGETLELYRLNDAKTIKLYVKKADDSAISISDPNIDNVVFEQKKPYERIEYMRVCTFNVGLWHDGNTKQPDATASAFAKSWRRFLGEMNPEVMAMLEAPSTINQSNTVNARDLYGFKLPFQYRDADGNSTGRLSVAKNSMLNPTSITFESGSGRPCFSFDYQVGDKMVHFVVVHLSIEHTYGDTDPRQKDLKEIKGWLDNAVTHGESWVVMGDFNIYNMSELDRFADYNVANGGIFGEFATWPNVSESWPNPAIDNIITTPGISIQNVFIADVSLSDHKPFVADLSLYY